MTRNLAYRAAAKVTRPARKAMHRRRRRRALTEAQLALMHSRGRGMRRAFMFEGTAVLVVPWHEAAEPPERGVRVEVRLLEEQPHRGTTSAAQRLVIDEPRFRVDIFDRTDQLPGNLRSAHFHSSFAGVEPCERQWTGALQKEPSAWLLDALSDLPGLLERSGGIPVDAPWLDSDTAALRAAIPSIVAVMKETLQTVRQGEP